MNVLIVGAGPTGLSAALELAHLGLKPLVIEKRTGPSELSRAVGILPGTRHHLSHQGVGDAILAEAMAIRKFTIRRENHLLAELDFSDKVEARDCILGLPQDRTEHHIREGLRRLGVEVRYGVEAVQVNTTEEVAEVALSDGTQQTVDWVLGCDGKHSTIRSQVGINYQGFDLDEEWSIADVDMGDGFDSERMQLWVQGPQGEICLCVPIESRRARVVSNTPDSLSAVPQPLPIEGVRRTGTFQISVRQADRYTAGRVLLAGDAAHCHSPVGGRGMNLGIDDAIAAAHAVLEGEVESYSAERHAVGARVIRTTETIRKKVSSGRLQDRVLLNTALGVVQHVRLLHGHLLEQMVEL